MTSNIMHSYTTKMQQQMYHMIAEKLSDFEQQLNSIIEEMVHDVYIAADEANDNMTKNIKDQLETFSKTILEQKQAAEAALKKLNPTASSSSTQSRFSHINLTQISVALPTHLTLQRVTFQTPT
jgi:gas vesicle protein